MTKLENGCPACGENEFTMKKIRDSSFDETPTCVHCGWQMET